jgi:hypothetical protein
LAQLTKRLDYVILEVELLEYNFSEEQYNEWLNWLFERYTTGKTPTLVEVSAYLKTLLTHLEDANEENLTKMSKNLLIGLGNKGILRQFVKDILNKE